MSIFYFILAIAALGVLVFIHELGHYIVARWMGMEVEIFSIGFGRPVTKWQVNKVQWQLGWLPLGGYVKIKGMEVGQKEKEDPYTIPGGFFARSPLKRIAVALAGPMANILLAFLLFALLYALGGREKPFSDYTQVVGWVDPHSEIYAQGVRPGDILTKYNNKKFTSSKDHIYAAMLHKGKISVEGYHVNYDTGAKTPFHYTINSYHPAGAREGLFSTGITSGAHYLIYDKFSDGANALATGSPMGESGIHYGDRLLWASGEYLFSLEQLSYLTNSNTALLTVDREGKHFLSRQPRLKVSNLALTPQIKGELSDWQHEADIQSRWGNLFVLPYDLSSQLAVKERLAFIEPEAESEFFPAANSALTQPLRPGDKILALDGIPVKNSYQFLELLQRQRLLFIVKKDVPVSSHTLWTQEDFNFEKPLLSPEVHTLQKELAQKNMFLTEKNVGDYEILTPVEPKSLHELLVAGALQPLLKRQWEVQKAGIEEMRNPIQRSQALQQFQQSEQRRILGIALQDRYVKYNPSPATLFSETFTETCATLKALVVGNLNPKWMSGPVGIMQVLHHGWSVGTGEGIFWIAAISLNLAIFNLLPIPVLDGGYICLSLYELVTKRRLKAKTMERLVIPFVVLLIGLIIFLTFQDILRFFK